MLKIKLFRGFAVVVILFSLLSAFVGVRTIKSRVTEEAQKRVNLDLSSAWDVLNNQLTEVETILRMAAGKEIVHEVCEASRWDDAHLRMRLELIRVNYGFDFLDLVSPEGQVVMRTAPPYATGDTKLSSPAVKAALEGRRMACISLLSESELAMEADGLAEQAFLELKPTPKARRTPKSDETRGMAIVGAVPVMSGAQVLGVVYGGILVNRNHALVDHIHEVVYKNATYRGRPLGTATIFLGDTRVATTVREANGNRAVGTRVSREVAERVLDNATPWVDKAFVVRDWYLTAYEPIQDGEGEVIGMLYVGVLEEPFVVEQRQIIFTYIVVSVLVLLVSLALAFILAGRLANPIHRLVEASDRMARGESPGTVATDDACQETEDLIHAFNQMAETLAEREARLKALNRSYMETLGFVSHELKSPVATIMNYVYLLGEQKLGPLTEKQQKAVRAIDTGSTRLVEMVRHYLNLSRIENDELQPVRSRVALLEDVVAPLVEASEGQVAEKQMRVDNAIPADVVLHADVNMLREIFENLLSNAIKYGREGGAISLVCGGRQDGYCEFTVRNEGEGIPEDKLPALFQKFSRLEGSKAVRRQKGTGLGLFITKHIIDGHGGTIRAASQSGEWAEFTFTLPAYEEASAT